MVSIASLPGQSPALAVAAAKSPGTFLVDGAGSSWGDRAFIDGGDTGEAHALSVQGTAFPRTVTAGFILTNPAIAFIRAATGRSGGVTTHARVRVATEIPTLKSVAAGRAGKPATLSITAAKSPGALLVGRTRATDETEADAIIATSVASTIAVYAAL